MPWKSFDYIESFLGPWDLTDGSIKQEIIDAAHWLKMYHNEEQGSILMALAESDKIDT